MKGELILSAVSGLSFVAVGIALELNGHKEPAFFACYGLIYGVVLVHLNVFFNKPSRRDE